MADDGQLSLDLARVVQRVSIWIDLVNDCGKSKYIGMFMFMELQPWVDVESLLACLEAERPINTPSTEKLASLSLFCLCCYILRRFSSTGVYHRMLAELMDSIEQYTPLNESQTHLQVWATILAAGIAKERTPLANRSEQLVDFVNKRLPAPPDVAYLDRILQRFLLFNHSIAAWTACWSAGLVRQGRRASP